MKLAFFGDSICVGQGISLERTWAVMLSGYLFRTKSNNKSLLVANSSINGRTTREALLDMPYHIQSHKFDTLLVQFGMNDCNYWKTDNGLPRVSQKSFEANLFEIISRARNFGAKNIILNTNHPTTRFDKFEYSNLSYQESNKQYNNIIRDVGHKSNSKVIDIEKQILKSQQIKGFEIKDILLDDKLHLSELGHELYFNIIKNTIDEL